MTISTRFFLAVAVVHFLFADVSCQPLTYAEIEAVGASCSPKDSCRVTRDLDSLESYNCDCDSRCTLYGTCCIDFHSFNVTRGRQRAAVCRTVSHSGPLAAFMIDKCPEEWRGSPSIRRRCEQPAKDFSDPVGNAPVTNLKTELTYKSFYCATCNGVEKRDLAMWQIFLDCSALGDYAEMCEENRKFVLDNIMYIREKGLWGLWSWNSKSDWKFRFLPVTYVIPAALKSVVTECRPHLVSECANDWTDVRVKRLCKAYMAAVYWPKVAFRNIHCALCNHVTNTTGMSCRNLDDTHYKSPTLTFGLLLDIDLEDGDTVGRVDRCAKGQIYDPLSKKCRSIECALPGTTLKEGRCVQS